VTSEAFLLAAVALAGYAVGGVMHIAIDYVHGKRLLRTYWAATDEKIAAIKGDVVEELAKKMPPNAVDPEAIGRGLEDFLRSSSGQQWATELASVTGAQVTQDVVTRLRQKAAGQAHSDQARIAHVLAENIRFDHPILDGAWAFLPRETKLAFVNRLAKVIRRAGIDNVIAEAERAEESSQPLELPSGGNEGLFP
jgi:hypothetical protein